MMLLNIAIDGPSAAGKSTIAKILAKHLGYVHLDTGAMYRCVAYQASKRNIHLDDEVQLGNMIDHMDIHFDSEGHVYIQNEDVSHAIRQNEISMMTSHVSVYPLVRGKLVALQQKIASKKGFILDGRDIGTVVMPNAEVKIFMIASVKARAQRRYKEYLDKHIVADYEEIYQDIEKRDYQDMNRKTSPLKKADDAVEIDTSNMSIEEVVSTILQYIKKAVK